MAEIGNKHTVQNMMNWSFDPVTNMNMVEPVGFDGQTMSRMWSSNLQIYTVSSGGYDYFCFAAPGTAQATAKWAIFRLDGSGNLMYADANTNFDNVATDPTLLTYAYS